MKKPLVNIFDLIIEHKFLFFFLIVITVLIIITHGNYGISWDEKDNRLFGQQALNYYKSLGIDREYFIYWKKDFLLSRGPFIEMISQILMNIFNNRTFEFYHLTIALFSLSAFYFLYKTVLLLTKNKFVSFCSLFLLLLMPRFYGDIFNNSKDIPPVYFLMGIIYFSTKILTKSRNIIDFIVLGFLGGIAVAQRSILAYSLFLFIIFYLSLILANRKTITAKTIYRNYLKPLSVLIVSFLLSLYLFQPYLHIEPITGIYNMYASSQKYEYARDMLFEGKVILSTKLPWYYIPKWIAISTPIITLFFSFIGLIISLISIKTKNYKKIIPKLFIISLFFFPFIIIIITKPVLYDAWRHFLFLTSPLILLSVLGFDFLLKQKTSIRIVALCLLIANIIIIGKEMIILHPYEYSFFNSFAGGLKGASDKYDTDYWGKSFKEATEWLRDKEIKNSTTIKYVYVTGDPTSSTYYFSKNMRQGTLENSDYFISYTRFSDVLLVDNKKTIHIVQREGVPLNYVKKMKLHRLTPMESSPPSGEQNPSEQKKVFQSWSYYLDLLRRRIK